MRYNTGNPVGADGSSDPRDLYDNAGVIDIFATDRNRVSTRDRLGANRPTLYGLEQQVQDWLAEQGFEPSPLVYVDGSPIDVDRPTQLIQRDDNLYSVRLPASFPVELSGTWSADQPLLVVQVDRSFEEVLGGGVRRVAAIADLQSIDGRYHGDVAHVVGYYTTTPGYGGDEVWWDATSTEAPNPGTIYTGAGGTLMAGRWKRPERGFVRAEDFGIRNDGNTVNRTDNTARFLAAVASLRANPTSILDYIGGSTITAYTSGVVVFGRGVFALDFDSLDFSQDFGLTLVGQGSRGTNQAMPAPTTLLFSGASSGFGMRFYGNGARMGTVLGMDVCYADANFTGDLVDIVTCPGISFRNCRLGCFGGTSGTRVQSAASLVRSSFDEFLLFDRVVFDGAVLGWWSDDVRSLGSLTFGGSKTRFRDCLFYDFTQSHIQHSGARTRQGLVLDNVGLNPINIAPVRGLDINNVEGLEVIGGICVPSTSSSPSEQWYKVINCTGDIKGTQFATSKAGTLQGMLTVTGVRVSCDTGFTLDGGVIVANSNEFSSGTQGYIITPSITLAVNLGPDLFKSAVTTSYYVPADSTLLSGRINYNFNNDASTSKMFNASTRITFRNLDEQIVTIASLPANGSALFSGRTYNITAPSGTFTMPTPVVGCKLRVMKSGATALTLAAAASTNFLTGATGARTSAVATAAELGACLEFEALSTTTWLVTVIRGTWSFT